MEGNFLDGLPEGMVNAIGKDVEQLIDAFVAKSGQNEVLETVEKEAIHIAVTGFLSLLVKHTAAAVKVGNEKLAETPVSTPAPVTETHTS